MKEFSKKDFTKAEWKVLSNECEECPYTEYYVDEPNDDCPDCGDFLLTFWNYDDLNCIICSEGLVPEEDVYELKGHEEEMICSCCYEWLGK